MADAVGPGGGSLVAAGVAVATGTGVLVATSDVGDAATTVAGRGAGVPAAPLRTVAARVCTAELKLPCATTLCSAEPRLPCAVIVLSAVSRLFV